MRVDGEARAGAGQVGKALFGWEYNLQFTVGFNEV